MPRSRFSANLFLAFFAFSLTAAFGAEPAPYDRGQREVNPRRAEPIVPGKNPVHFRTVVVDEAFLYDYTPRFAPGRVTFDSHNRPYIRVGFEKAEADGTEPPAFGYVDKGYIQTLDDAGKWVIDDFRGAIKKKYPDWPGSFFGGPFALEAVFFDAQDAAYTVVEAGKTGRLLMSSTDGLKTWEIDTVQGRRPSVEMWMVNNDRSQPPAIASSDGDKVLLTLPRREADGSLTVPDPILVHTVKGGKAWVSGTSAHSGATNCTATRDGKVFIVWAESVQVPQFPGGTPQYVATVDRATGAVSKPVLLGAALSNTTKKADGHNSPSILIDSKGYLHAMLGSHQKPFLYTKSLKPGDASEWTAPVEVSNPDPRGHETYVGMVIDPQDALHLVSRVVDDDGYSLHYMRKRVSDPKWVEMGKLVRPPHFPYSIYYHKVSVDRRGRVFVAYTFWTKFTAADADLFRRKYAQTKTWPYTNIDGKRATYEQGMELVKKNPKGSWLYHNAVRHWAILMTDDGGDTWRLATTPDFVDGMR